ncbi:MAG: polysaccharide deacetylase family protein [Oscillospiraceae bacterium]
MKKLTAIILLLSILFSFVGCKNKKDDKESTEATTKKTTTTQKEVTTKEPKPVIGEPSTQSSQAGGTFTGRKPLKEVKMTASDPENTRGLDTTGHGYGFGVSTGAKPHSISVNNQKIFDSYGAIALDTKTKKKVLYLTFDCGYENGNTAKILDVLTEKKVPAAFFVTLPYLKENLGQKMAVRMINEGHIIGNHSTTHPVFPDISRQKMASEIEMCDNYLRTKFGYTSPYFRFPTGEYSDSSLDLVKSLGYTSVFWSVAYLDYDTKNQPSSEKAMQTITSRLHPGAVILLHAVSSANASVLGDVVDWAREQGYTFVPLSDYKSTN